MIRVKSGNHDSTFFKVFQVYQIVLLFRRRVGMKYMYIFFIYSSRLISLTDSLIYIIILSC